jgi:PIN domain nuclease of toxin-antitoxin system
VLLWLLRDPERVRADVLALLADPRSSVSVSLASIWEIAIKIGIEKLDLGAPLPTLPRAIAEIGVNVLGIGVDHVLAVAALPRHHRDPFDRLIIAQAIAENSVIVSSDNAFARYPVRVLTL